MTPTELIAAFESLAEAPDGVARLRVLILQLAVRGRLVPQSPRDESGAALLAGIPAEMRKLAAAGLVRKVELYPSVEVSQLGFGLPTGWSAAPLGNVALVLDHLREPVKADEREARCAGKQADALYPYFGATQQQGWIDDYRLDGEFVLLGEDGVPFLDPLRHKAYLVSGRIWVNNHAHVLLGVSFSNAFLLHYLNQFDYAGRVTGTTRAKLTKGDLVDIPIPVPPLAEQHRIVARVEELMGLLDRLEAARARRETTRAAARDSVLAALREADSPAEVDAAWTRFAQRMDDLVCDPADIAPLRETVLQLAVRGRLVRQDPRDEPPFGFLEQIAAEKARKHNSGRGDSSEAALPVSENEEPYGIPQSWCWVRFGETHINRDAERVPLSREVRSRRSGPFDYYGASGVIDKVDAFLFDRVHLLVGEDGANLLLRSTPIAFLAHGKYWVNNHAHVLDSPEAESLGYLAVFVNATDLRPYVTGTAQPKLNQARMNSMPCPFPPLAEQRRIVARVEELMGLLHRLEARLTAGQTVHESFAAAAVHHLET